MRTLYIHENYCVAPNNLRLHFLHQTSMHTANAQNAFNKLSSTMFTHSSSWCYINLAHHQPALRVDRWMCASHDKDARKSEHPMFVYMFSLSTDLWTVANTYRSFCVVQPRSSLAYDAKICGIFNLYTTMCILCKITSKP